MSYRILEICLACGSDQIMQTLDLGPQPPANQFHDGSKPLSSYPLILMTCRNCWHSQQRCGLDPRLLFTNYAYVSGTSKSLGEYFDSFVEKVEGDFGPKNMPPGRLNVLEIGSNDGSLLSRFAKRGHYVQGVDPAGNLMRLAKDKGVPTYNAFWPPAPDQANRIGGPFQVIIAMNVLAHTVNPLGFLQAARQFLAPGGRIYVQTSQAEMIQGGQFDTIYHEHVSFFTARSFDALAWRAKLTIDKLSRVPVHGGSYLVEMTAVPSPTTLSLTSEINVEHAAGLYTADAHHAFARHAEAIRAEVCVLIEEKRSGGFEIVGYGAAAKGVVFLNYTGIRPAAVLDDNPLKFGMLMPGSNVFVLSGQEIGPKDKPTLWLILAWNMREEIVAKIKAARGGCGDEFLTVFPEIELTK